MKDKIAYRNGLEDFVFYDRNATKAYSESCTDLLKLKLLIDWQTMTETPALDGFCKYFLDKHNDPRYVDRMEKRQAEFLIKGKVPLIWMTRIGVINQTRAEEVNAILLKHNVNLAVDVMTDWYFLGQ